MVARGDDEDPVRIPARAITGNSLTKKQMWAGALFLLTWFLMDLVMFVDWLIKHLRPPCFGMRDATPGREGVSSPPVAILTSRDDVAQAPVGPTHRSGDATSARPPSRSAARPRRPNGSVSQIASKAAGVMARRITLETCPSALAG